MRTHLNADAVDGGRMEEFWKGKMGVDWMSISECYFPGGLQLFGSRAKDAAVRSSDIDVGGLPLDPLPADLLFEIREALENSTVLPSVDLVDLSQVDTGFRERVLREGTAWTS